MWESQCGDIWTVQDAVDSGSAVHVVELDTWRGAVEIRIPVAAVTSYALYGWDLALNGIQFDACSKLDPWLDMAAI
jgi:hypothetical protein